MGIEIGDWGLGNGDCDWGFGLRIGIGDREWVLEFGIEIGDLTLFSYYSNLH